MHVRIHAAHLSFPEPCAVLVQWKRKNANRCLPKGRLCSSEQKSFVCLLYEKEMLLVESSGARLCSGPKGKGAAVGVFEEELSH